MIQEEKVVVVDVDGTIALGPGDPDTPYATAPVSEAMRQRLLELKAEGYWIILYTSRNMRSFAGNIGKIMKHTAPVLIDWLDAHVIPYDELHFGKPWCGHDGFYIDDRAIRPREFLQHSIEDLRKIVDRDRIRP